MLDSGGNPRRKTLECLAGDKTLITAIASSVNPGILVDARRGKSDAVVHCAEVVAARVQDDGNWGAISLSCSAKSRPSISGIRTSRIATSGHWAATVLRAWEPILRQQDAVALFLEDPPAQFAEARVIVNKE